MSPDMTTKERVLAYFAAANEDRTDDVLASFHEDGWEMKRERILEWIDAQNREGGPPMSSE